MKQTVDSVTPDEKTKSVNPFVFISHDTRDAEFAEAFSTLLKSVSAGVLKSFRSSDKKGNQGIEFGIEWYPEIIKNIQGASDVVCLLTENSINRPWILFEAGMAKGKLDTPILGVALGVELREASTGPFAQFQNCADDEDSLTKLLVQLVNRIPNAEPDKDTIRFQVGKFKNTIAEVLKKGRVAKSKEKTHQANASSVDLENSSVKLFEEIKLMFKDLPGRIENNGRANGQRRRRKMFHAEMMNEIMHMSKNKAMGIRIALSCYRDRFPWIYEEGTQILNRVSMGKRPQSDTKRAYMEMEEVLTLGMRNPFVEELYDDEMDYVMIKELPHMILKMFDRHIHDTAMNESKAL